MLNRHVGQSPRPRWGMWIVLALAICRARGSDRCACWLPHRHRIRHHQPSDRWDRWRRWRSHERRRRPLRAAPSSGSHAVISGLPFTGFDVGVLALASVALLGAGLTLRRLSDPARRSSS